MLRFWESQFPLLKPNKSGTGQRLYRRRDVEMALEIKRLVHAEGYTLAGARTVLDQEQRRPGKRKQPQTALPLLAGRNQRLDGVAAAHLATTSGALQYPANSSVRMSSSSTLAPTSISLMAVTMAGGPAA